MDLMMALSDGAKSPTRLMYITNLSWAPLQQCLRIVIDKGLVEESRTTYRRRLYALTNTGTEIMGRYKNFLRDVVQVS